MGRTGGLLVSSLIVICLMISWNTGIGVLGTVFKMTPDKDLFLIKGSELNMNCTVNDSSYDVDKIGIGLNCTSNETVYNCIQIPDQWLERVTKPTGQRTLMVQKPNVSEKDDGAYTCYYGIPPRWKSAKIVRVADMPSKPENISCVSHNFEDLECSASVRPTGIPMEWFVNYTVDGLNHNANCEAISNRIKCDPTTDFYDHQLYTITMFGWNEDYNVLVKATFHVKTNYSIVKPDPVRDLHVHLTNISSEAIIIWKPPDLYTTDMELEYRILLKESAQKFSQSKIYKVKQTLRNYSDLERHITYNVTNLIPHRNYTISVSCKPVEAQGNLYWSNATVYVFTTNIDIPGSSVELLPGSFQYLPANDSEIYLTLYWKDPPDRESHGDINIYKIQITETRTIQYAIGNETRHLDSDGLALAVLSAESVNVDQEVVLNEEFVGDRENVSLELALNRSAVYTVQVWAGNDAGFTDFPVNISIPSLNEVKKLLPSVVIVERDKRRGRSLVSWMGGYSNTESISMVTVYSCEGYPHGERMFCKDINWSRTHFEDKPIWMSAPETYQFAVALETEEGLSGGVLWQSHDFIYNRVPEIPTYVVNADPNNHTILYIAVTYSPASSGGKPESYGIAVHKQDENHQEKCPKVDAPLQQPVNFRESRLLLTGLEPDTDYRICMDARNLKGRSGFGKPFFVRTSTKPAAEDIQLYVYIVCGIAGSAFIVILGLVLYCWCKRKIESIKLNNKIEDVEVVVGPVVTNGYRHTDGMRISLPDTTPIETHNLSDSGEGFVQDKHWSLISNNSGYSQGNAKRRNSSSGLSGYLHVDGDTYGLSMSGETDSLIEANHGGDENEKGDTNEYFDLTEKRNVYHDIDENTEFHNPGTSYITEAKAAHDKNALNDSNSYTDTVPPLVVSSVSKLPSDGENIGKGEVMSVIDTENLVANVDTKKVIEKKENVPNHQIKHNTAKDEYLLGENQQTFEPVALKSKSFANMDDDFYHQNDESSISVSKQSTKNFTADPSKGFIQSTIIVPDQDDNPSQNDTSAIEAGVDDNCAIEAGVDDSNLSEVTTESNQMDKEDCWDVEVADNSGNGEYMIEEWDSSYTDDMEHRPDTYCNPDSISIEEEYKPDTYYNPYSISGEEESINSENLAPQNDALKINTHEKTEDKNTISVKKLAKTLQVHCGKENGKKIISDDKNLLLLKRINHHSSGPRATAVKEQRMSDIEDKSSSAESNQSSDTYVCAKINQSV